MQINIIIIINMEKNNQNMIPRFGGEVMGGG